MKTPHTLRVEEGPESFAPLLAAARTLGLRIGWLELGPRPDPLPTSLEQAAGLGAMRAVSVGEGRSVAVKPLRGAAVLRDLLREHFQGCVLVLIRGEVTAPALGITDDGWTVKPAGTAARRFTPDTLAAALRKPHPWGDPPQESQPEAPAA